MAALINYVKFARGTPAAFSKLTNKNNDTLYFISEAEDKRGSLYLGSKLISKDISNLSELEDVVVNDLLSNGDILTYDQLNEKWVNKNIADAIGLMIGATETAQGGAGLVPAPGIGQDSLFLRGDGVWAAPYSMKTDPKTISLDNNQTISLKDFGLKYYRYIADQGSEEEENYVPAHYEAQQVDEKNPWKAGLEPRVVEENGELVLGWFEPNLSSIDGIKDSVNTLVTDIKTLKDNVYTKVETLNLVNNKIASVDHLKRKTFASIEDANMFIFLEDEPENYIYMILSKESRPGDNQYDEYLFIDGVLDKVGSWNVNLDGYAKLEDLKKYVAKVDGYGLISNKDLEKLGSIEQGAQKNLFDSVNSDEFVIDNNRCLNILSIPVAKISGLSENYINKIKYDADMKAVMDSTTWQGFA